MKFGRHLRLPDGAKLIVGRNQEDNQSLKSIKNGDYTPIVLPIIGPFSLIHKNASKQDKELGAKIAVTYGKSRKDVSYSVKVGDEVIVTKPFESKSLVQKYFI